VLLFGLGLQACGGPVVLAGRARPDALACALRQGAQLGYTPRAGGIADGYLRLESANAWTGADVAAEATTRVFTFGLAGTNRTVRDEINVVVAAGLLQVRATGFDEDGAPGEPSFRAQTDAEGIIAACGVVSARSRATP
jgi:hypothetical protein